MRARPVSVCASGREKIDDKLGGKMTAICANVWSLEQGDLSQAQRTKLHRIRSSAVDVEQFLAELTPCHGCGKCTRDAAEVRGQMVDERA